MKVNWKLALAAVAAVAGLGLFIAVFAVGDNMPAGMVGLCAGIGGALLGLGGGALVIPLYLRAAPEEQRREMERVERDERNAAIRLHAGLSTWHWTLVALWLPFVVALMQGQRLWIGLCCAMLVCHSAFYLVNIYRWSKKF